MTLDLAKVRNIGIAAHIDAGKTTTTERILYYSGKTHRMGNVDEGTTTTDFDEEEQKRGITIYSAAVSCSWNGHTINLIDTPGHVDFTAEVERALRVLDGMVALFSAREGVEAQSETVWRQAQKYSVPRLCFINKMDRVGADFERTVEAMKERLGADPLLLQLPIGAGDSFAGLIDLIDMQAVYYKADRLGASFQEKEIPEDLADEAREHHNRLIERLASTSDELMEKYIEDKPLSREEMISAVRSLTVSGQAQPVLCGSSLRYIGVQRLLDAVCDFLPSPLDVPPVIATDARNPEKSIELSCDPNGPLAALVFKIVSEKPMDLSYLRIYSGTLKANSRLVDTATGKKENISRIHRMFAKRREQLTAASAGDIVAVVGPRTASTGHTLCDPRRMVVLEKIEFPETVISVSVEPSSSKDRDKLIEALKALERQDPTVLVSANPETGQTLLSGMGELHLEILVQRIQADFNVGVRVGKPRVSYRETVSATGEGEGRFSRKIGDREHFAVVRLRIEPSTQGVGRGGFETVNAVPEGSLLPEYIQATEMAVAEAAQSGILGGYPVINWKVTILGGRQHEKDSSELAFENAGQAAFYEAMKAAKPVLLQPIMDVEVVTPDEFVGPIVGDLNARHAAIRETAVRGTDRIIIAHVPLREMFAYSTRLRSVSRGRATSSMSPSHYAEMPPQEVAALIG